MILEGIETTSWGRVGSYTRRVLGPRHHLVSVVTVPSSTGYFPYTIVICSPAVGVGSTMSGVCRACGVPLLLSLRPSLRPCEVQSQTSPGPLERGPFPVSDGVRPRSTVRCPRRPLCLESRLLVSVRASMSASGVRSRVSRYGRTPLQRVQETFYSCYVTPQNPRPRHRNFSDRRQPHIPEGLRNLNFKVKKTLYDHNYHNNNMTTLWFLQAQKEVTTKICRDQLVLYFQPLRTGGEDGDSSGDI